MLCDGNRGGWRVIDRIGPDLTADRALVLFLEIDTDERVGEVMKRRRQPQAAEKEEEQSTHRHVHCRISFPRWRAVPTYKPH
jgi:hypothetical protein